MRNFNVGKGFLALSVTLAFVFPVFTQSVHATAQEGVDYVMLAKPIPNMGSTVLKVFSYDCPACYIHDKSVTSSLVNILAKSVIKFTIFGISKTSARSCSSSPA